MKRVILDIDEEACWGCKACEVACKQEYHQPEGINYIRVTEEGPKIVRGKLYFRYRVSLCHHCDDPPCVTACPEQAIAKRRDGIVVLDDQRCTGCQLCIDACPYGAICFDSGNRKAQKCNLCFSRVDQGLYPACADNVCLAHAIHFGDSVEVTRRRTHEEIGQH